jgi:hypothetical protein
MSRWLRTMVWLGIASWMLLLITPAANAQGETIVASDNFNRPDETPFAVGGNWGRTVAGNFDGVSRLANNRVTSVSNEGIYYWQGAGTFDPTRQYSRLKVVQKDGEVGLVLLGGSNQAIMVAWGPPGAGDVRGEGEIDGHLCGPSLYYACRADSSRVRELVHRLHRWHRSKRICLICGYSCTPFTARTNIVSRLDNRGPREIA